MKYIYLKCISYIWFMEHLVYGAGNLVFNTLSYTYCTMDSVKYVSCTVYGKTI